MTSTHVVVLGLQVLVYLSEERTYLIAIPAYLACRSIAVVEVLVVRDLGVVLLEAATVLTIEEWEGS